MTPRAIYRSVCLLGVSAALGWSQRDLAEASLEELLNTKITSVSKKEQTLSRTVAAVFVINQDDIRRSGATSIPDLLRMVPRVEVAQIDANRWAVSIRGFNYAYANKVLLLIDGRSVYAGTFSGVMWDQVSVPLEDIDRIEVIRGQGGSVWGADAVNGVISIVTKSSQDTKGGMLAVGGGSLVSTDDTVRYGGNLGRSGSYRVFGRYSRTSDFDLPGGGDAGDGWDRKQGGFRADWSLSSSTSLPAEGSYFHNHGGQDLTGSLFQSQPGELFESGFFAEGGGLGTRWKHTLASGAEESLQLSYTAWDRIEQGTPVSDRSLDIEYQNHFHIGSRHDLVAGFGYRRDTGTLNGTQWIWFSPPTRTDNLLSGFFQDEIALGPAVRLTIGSKFEHNSYTGFEFEPTLRLAWVATSKSTLWASANRAIAQPAQYETSISAIVGSVPVDANNRALIWLYGNPNLRAEEFRDAEYRNQFARSVSMDLATFVGSYLGLVAVQAQTASAVSQSAGAQIQLATVVANTNKAFTYGGEFWVNWDVNRRWRLSSGYTLLEQAMTNTAASFLSGTGLSTDPKHVFQAHSRLDLPGKLEFDQWIWWTSDLAANQIPAHTRVDARLARPLGESAEISITWQNLTRPRFIEFGDSYGFAGTANPRSVFAQLRWFF